MEEQIKEPRDVPRHEVPLPSCGKIYPSEHKLSTNNLIEGKYVAIRAMGIVDEDILSSEPLIRSGDAINEFVKSAVGGSLDVSLLLPADREAIMHAFRATGYGTEYPVDFECTCKAKYEYIFQLQSLEIQELEINPVSPGTNLFDLPEPLPISNARIQFSLLTVGNEKEIDTIIDNTTSKMKSRVQPNRSLRMKYMIQSINGNSDRNKIGKFVERMAAADSMFVRKYVNQISPKVITARDVTCPHCGRTERKSLPLEVQYFFPEDNS